MIMIAFAQKKRNARPGNGGPTLRAYRETVYPRKDALTESPEINKITNKKIRQYFCKYQDKFS
jgi:hypothetical protein